MPNSEALDAVKALLEIGVENGALSPDYKLYGHRDAPASKTDGPGDALYKHIQNWDHYDFEEPERPTHVF